MTKIRIMLGKCDTCGNLTAISDKLSPSIGDATTGCRILYSAGDEKNTEFACPGTIIAIAYVKEIGE